MVVLAVVKKESTSELELRADGPGLGTLATCLTTSTGPGYLQLDGVDDPWPLAANLRDLASTGSTGDHLHIEWFPEHFYLSGNSEALVISFAG